MRFWDYLIDDIGQYNIHTTPSILPTKNDNNLFITNYLRHPDKSVAIIRPKTFDDVLRLVDFVSGNRSAVVDFNALDNATLSRAIDFLSGAVCALHGQMHSVADGIYLYAPKCTKLMTNKRKKRKDEK